MGVAEGAVGDRTAAIVRTALIFSAVFAVLKKVKPDAIFHLASHANVRASFINPLAVIQNNVMGTANLLEAIRTRRSVRRFTGEAVTDARLQLKYRARLSRMGILPDCMLYAWVFCIELKKPPDKRAMPYTMRTARCGKIAVIDFLIIPA